MLLSALAASGLAPDRLELEITETVLLHDSAAILAILFRLRELGVRIAMDDFGPGYSSLSHLQRFPFDKIKIDRFFINNIAADVSSLNIVPCPRTSWRRSSWPKLEGDRGLEGDRTPRAPEAPRPSRVSRTNAKWRRPERYCRLSASEARGPCAHARFVGLRRSLAPTQVLGVRLSSHAGRGSAGSANRRQNVPDIRDTRRGNAGIARARPGIGA